MFFHRIFYYNFFCHVVQSLDIVCHLFGISMKNCSVSSGCQEITRVLDTMYLENTSWSLRESICFLSTGFTWLKLWPTQPSKDKYKVQQRLEKTCDSISRAKETSLDDSLPVAGKILAAKLMIVSTILGKIENPDDAVLSCLQFLQKLNDLPEIQRTFSVLTKRTTSILDRSCEYAISIHKMNRILFEFAVLFLKPPPSVNDWPVTLKVGEESFNILTETRSLKLESGMISTNQNASDSGKVDGGVLMLGVQKHRFSITPTTDNRYTVITLGLRM